MTAMAAPLAEPLLLRPIPLPPADPISSASQILFNRHLSLPRLLKSCADSAALSPGRQLHALSIKLRFSSDPYIQTSLLSMYSACSLPYHALRLFDRMPHRTLVAWTAATDACLRAARPHSALAIFSHMIASGTIPDSFTLVSALSACADIGALHSGRSVHALITKTRMPLTMFLSTALINMYCKSGSVDDAVTIFNSTPSRTVEVYNAMLHGLAMHGLGHKAVSLFTEMTADSSVKPNEVTFMALLCGCAHAGLVREGRLYFNSMRGEYGVKPTVKHYGCMVDLLGRAGLLEEAFDMVISMEIPANIVVWGALLASCRVHSDVEMAERVMERILLLGEIGDTSHYVIMSNMYRRAGRLTEMAMVRREVGRKPTGRSWIEIDGLVSKFGVGADASSHPNWSEIQTMLDAVDVKLRVEMRDGVNTENPHSERLALAFGLIRSRGSAPIRISKNLRICEKCHEWMKLVSRVYEREIIVRDCNRFHRFKGGLCSCKDFW